MLYAYFGSKQGLYLAYIDRTGRELLERLLGAAQPEQPPAAPPPVRQLPQKRLVYRSQCTPRPYLPNVALTHFEAAFRTWPWPGYTEI
jgi:AcrR family transcriptional regulator